MSLQARGNSRIHGAIAPIALLVLIVAAGCASRFEMTELWKDPSFNSGPMRNVLVVALRNEPVRRRLWEDSFTQDLMTRGVTATSSYKLFPQAPPDTQDVIDAVRKNGYDAVILTFRLPNETQSTYVPGSVRREPVTVQDFLGRFHTYWQEVQDPGHTEIDEVRSFQTDVWATAEGGHVIWSSTLRTLESVNNDIVHSAVSKHVLPTLEKQGLVPEKKK